MVDDQWNPELENSSPTGT
nr:unnamed protein product [Callosobruchus chinensis]